MAPAYFQTVCLFLAIYSILLLFFLGDSKNHSYSNHAWSIFVILTIISLVYYLIKEILCFSGLMRVPKRKSYITVIATVFGLFLISYFFVFLFSCSEFIKNDFWNKISQMLHYISIFIPFVSFVVCFLLHWFSIIYSKCKLCWYNLNIKRLSVKQNRILERENNNLKLNF